MKQWLEIAGQQKPEMKTRNAIDWRIDVSSTRIQEREKNYYNLIRFKRGILLHSISACMRSVFHWTLDDSNDKHSHVYAIISELRRR